MLELGALHDALALVGAQLALALEGDEGVTGVVAAVVGVEVLEHLGHGSVMVSPVRTGRGAPGDERRSRPRQAMRSTRALSQRFPAGRTSFGGASAGGGSETSPTDHQHAWK